MNHPSSITLCEVGLRDGLQNEPTILTTDQKVEILRGLVDAGFKVIEVGSFMHPVKVPQMANTDDVFKAIGGEIPGVQLRALIPNKRGVDRAVACGCKKVKLNVSASKMHNIKNLNRTPAESVAGFKEACDAAAAAGIEISGSISMPFASPWEGRIPVDVPALSAQNYPRPAGLEEFYTPENRRRYYLSYELEADHVILSAGTSLLTVPKQFAFCEPHISFELRKLPSHYIVTITSDVFVQAAMLECGDHDVQFSDNWIDLHGGVPVTVTIPKQQDLTLEILRRELRVVSQMTPAE